MAVYLPTAAVGNGRVLATLGGAGELMGFFYPRLDFAQNVREALPALYVGDPGHGVFHWTFGRAFRRRQTYFRESGLVRTELNLDTPPLQLLLEDFCPPECTALVRRAIFRNTGSARFEGTFLHYFHLRLGEIEGKQAVRWEHDTGQMVQYFRDIVLAVGGTRADLWRCGKGHDPEAPSSAKSDLYDGHLNGQPEDIGAVDFALGWRLDLGPGEARVIELMLCAEENPGRTSAELRKLARTGSETLRERAVAEMSEWVARAQPVEAPSSLQAAYQRALVSLRMLVDEATGAMLAAPEFDPAYERSGGYGYCWPRDASWAADSLERAGYPEYGDRLADWYVRHQLPSGYWGQRYWCDGQLAASWALREDFLQLDQCGAALETVARSALREDDPERRQRLWQALRRGAEAVVARVSEGWHHHACDLWETYCGSFVYSNAALAAGLSVAAEVGAAEGEGAEAQAWQDLAEQMRTAALGLYTGDYFPRGLWADGHVDYSVDTSTLGLVAPFRVLDLGDARQREQAESNLGVIRERLREELDGGVGLRRYEGDAYLGGVIGCVNTLWAALVTLKLARAWQGEDRARAEAHREQALADLEFCLSHGTPTGLLPELIGIHEVPYWAAPHSWASALLLDCVLELAGLGE